MTPEEKISRYIKELMSKKIGQGIGMSPEWAADTLIASHKQQGKALHEVKMYNKKIAALSKWRRFLLKIISNGIVK